MKTLIQDGELRRRIADNAHQTVLDKHTLAGNAERWMQVYERALASKAKTSIIIPTFNNLELTRNCLAAIQKNTPAGLYKIIMVDNASTDGTVAFLKKRRRPGICVSS